MLKFIDVTVSHTNYFCLDYILFLINHEIVSSAVSHQISCQPPKVQYKLKMSQKTPLFLELIHNKPQLRPNLL